MPRQLGNLEELTNLATTASKVHSRITEVDLEDIRLFYNVLIYMVLRVSGPEEWTDDPPEGFVAIYKLVMQQGLRLLLHLFFHEVLRDFNLVQCQIAPNGWSQMVATFLLLKVAEV
ncbi:Uncharacterized protein Adt_21166 [Abeliophyllum distichum]|uniref:Uncharacterized protein n=1 Tax=Abeliophyllum distichum TaxID=126358 RepID=A0ABD1SYK0_9LAMI